jgi:GT2 family glycosyltransferase
VSEGATSEVDVGHPVAGATIGAPARIATRPAVSVIVCGYTEDRWDDLTRAVRSLHEQTEPAREIILVVDHCPGLLRRARAELAGVSVVPNRLANGLAGGRNTGLAEAEGDVVAFLDDDATADPDWIARLADHYAEARVVGVGGLVKPVWESGRPRWFPPELDWVVGCSYRGMRAGRGPVRNFIGANMSFRREVLEDLHGFLTSLGRVGTAPLGCEETEFCLRVSQRYPDGVLLYEPTAAVSHRVASQRTGWGYLAARCFAEGLSKAKVARLAGTRRALTSERSYVRSTVPRGLGRSLGGAARGHLIQVVSALALVCAVVVTGAGYATGRVAGPWAGLVPVPAPQPRIGQAARRPSLPALVPWAGLAVSAVAWGIALAQTNVALVQTAGLGLFSALPVTFWVAVAVLVVSFCWAVAYRPRGWPALAAHTVALVAILHATPVILYGTLRYSWAWKHVGVIDFISRHGIEFHLGGVLGAYQGWPGFFALNSFLTSASGQGSALSYASWALPVNDLLWLGPVVLIARAFTTNQRMIWTAAWVFALGNWVGQDYFSPQAFAYFLYLTVIAICLRWLRAPRSSWRPVLARLPLLSAWQSRVPRPAPVTRRPDLVSAGWGDPGTPSANGHAAAVAAAPPPPHGRPAGSRPPRSAATRRVLVIVLLPLMAAIASSHQLTPFMLIAALALLVLFRQIRPWWLPVAMAVITIGWVAFGGLPWLAANSSQLFEGLGLPWANTSSHLIGETQVPSGQIIAEWGARLLSFAVAVLAAVGYLRYRRRHYAWARRFWLSIPLLAAAGIPSAAANSYGGEIIFRVFLFAVPFLAVAAAATFFPHPRAGRPARTGLALTATLLVLVTGFCLSNYGSEAENYFSPAEVAASDWLYRTAPPGAQLVAANSNFPWAFVHYNWYGYTFLDTPPSLGSAALKAPVTTMVGLMKPGHTPASYLILTRGQAAQVLLTGEWPPGGFSGFTHDLLASGRFRIVYQNADAMILQLVPPGFRQLAPDGVLELSPAASVHPPALARQPRPAAAAGPARTRSPGKAARGCPIGNLPAQFWLAGAPAWLMLAPGHVPSQRLLALRHARAPLPVPAQTRALLRECR